MFFVRTRTRHEKMEKEKKRFVILQLMSVCVCGGAGAVDIIIIYRSHWADHLFLFVTRSSYRYFDYNLITKITTNMRGEDDVAEKRCCRVYLPFARYI